jgi:sterol desaturase/sphingolipid hydroxylase (fatty acid hydroxylase superfamily)
MPVSRGTLIDVGKRAGVTSGVLGALAVLAELCFLFPNELVFRDAMPFYAAHIGALRALLGAVIVTTLVLGAASVLILRSRSHGAIGIGLALIALLAGGSEARAITSEPRTLTAGLDFFVLQLFVLGLVFVPMERLWTLREQRIFREEWQTDLKYFFASHVGIQVISFATMIPVQVFFSWAVRLEFQEAVAAQPLWLQFVQILLLVDFVSYWAHRAFHVVPWLWKFHAIHHSSTRLDWLAGSRLHLVDIIVMRLVGFIPIFVCGFAPAALYAYLSFISFHAVYIHANVSHRWPGMRHVLATPEFHHWHHAAEEEGVDKNFAVLLPLVDRLFGTAHLPGRWPAAYGTIGEQLPDGFAAQFAHPFRRRTVRTG